MSGPLVHMIILGFILPRRRVKGKGALLWNDLQNSCVFLCVRQGSAECSGGGKTLEKFLSALGEELAKHYRMDRGRSGTTGKGHNYQSPGGIVRMNTGC